MSSKNLWLKIGGLLFILSFVLLLSSFVVEGSCARLAETYPCDSFEALYHLGNLIFSLYFAVIAFIVGSIVGGISKLVIDKLFN